jgi:hypothetical protein
MKQDFLASLLFPQWKSARFPWIYGVFTLFGAIANP